MPTKGERVRKAPDTPAKDVKVGTRMPGADGHTMYEAIEMKNGVMRWQVAKDHE
ncbi:hypothetical protein DUNSADRAFT_11979 [Dunaliella salina]|uniref:Encoded protein n=1 Tax=Dunaliella salina TaxID=3046 RepID=A0ABQ7GC83_DUNSA|nr:hypothetical protein DUNSADRAFT_11979 [Dunaliella salina]|eukprot:KAF5832222.1 hypothetical protein DUNSADRAFT_11979 [Dunaliella salina]